MNTTTLAVSPSATSTAAALGSDARPSSLRRVGVRELLDLFEQSTDAVGMESLRTRWVDAVGPERTAAELLRVIREGPSRDRATAFAWLVQMREVAEASVRVGLDDRCARPYCVVWLREMGLRGPKPTAAEVRWLYVDLLAVALDDEDRLAASAFRQVAADGSLEEQIRDVSLLWRSRHPATVEALEMMGRRHPEPGVAKVARLAAARAREASRRGAARSA